MSELTTEAGRVHVRTYSGLRTDYDGRDTNHERLTREVRAIEAEARADAEATLRKRESELETLFAAAHAAVTYRNERTLDNLAATMLYLPQPPKADAEATIQRLREARSAVQRVLSDVEDMIVRNMGDPSPGQEDVASGMVIVRDAVAAKLRHLLEYGPLTDTAPESERQVIDTPQRCGMCHHRWTHCQCNPQRTAPERA